MLDIYVDGDGCPVKQEVYRVARRCGLKVFLVANAWMQVPKTELFQFVLAPGGLDAADDWIAEHVQQDDIVITCDIPLAARCLAKEARAVSSRGRLFSEESIGEALAERELFAHLREMGTIAGGPAPFAKQDRSRFLQTLDTVIQAVRCGK